MMQNKIWLEFCFKYNTSLAVVDELLSERSIKRNKATIFELIPILHLIVKIRTRNALEQGSWGGKKKCLIFVHL